MQASFASQEVPPEVVELAGECVRYVKEALDIELDFTPETLPILDHYLRERARGAETGVFDLLAPLAGAYFGEVIRRGIDGTRWHGGGAEYADYRIEFEQIFLAFNPMGVALEVLTQADSSGLGAHFQLLDEARAAVESSLDSSAAITAEDYYTLTVRYEVLLQVVGVLVGLESQQPQRRIFGRDVYRAAQPKEQGDEADDEVVEQ
ncbi:MAG: hypothetical protein OEZ06_16150 [Myxococcales bacterium]|nr:hypothetical protein [Myxococcales bacterium]